MNKRKPVRPVSTLAAERDARLNADAVKQLTKENKDLLERLKGGDGASRAAAAAADDKRMARVGQN